MNVLISSCLLGISCRYNGTGILIDNLDKLKEKHKLIPVCPEIYGGMSTPREPSEIKDGRVVTISGEDVSEFFERGAQEVLKFAKLFDCRYAILKERSPSCGYGEIYDGTFSQKTIDGNGILAELLTQNGLTVIGESQINTIL